MNGKGSRPRPMVISREEYARRFDEAFRKKKPMVYHVHLHGGPKGGEILKTTMLGKRVEIAMKPKRGMCIGRLRHIYDIDAIAEHGRWCRVAATYTFTLGNINGGWLRVRRDGSTLSMFSPSTCSQVTRGVLHEIDGRYY